jgi:hypothetical protein
VIIITSYDYYKISLNKVKRLSLVNIGSFLRAACVVLVQSLESRGNVSIGLTLNNRIVENTDILLLEESKAIENVQVLHADFAISISLKLLFLPKLVDQRYLSNVLEYCPLIIVLPNVAV